MNLLSFLSIKNAQFTNLPIDLLAYFFIFFMNYFYQNYLTLVCDVQDVTGELDKSRFLLET